MNRQLPAVRVGMGAAVNPIAAMLRAVMKAPGQMAMALAPKGSFNRAAPACPPGTVRQGANCVAAKSYGGTAAPTGAHQTSQFRRGVSGVGAIVPCPPGTVRHVNGSCVYMPSFGDASQTTSAGSGLPPVRGMGALPPVPVSVGVGSPMALADPVGNMFKAIARAVVPGANSVSRFYAVGTTKTNWNNGVQFIQNAATILSRGWPNPSGSNILSAANNVTTGYQAAGAVAPKFAFNGKSAAASAVQVQTAIIRYNNSWGRAKFGASFSPVTP